MKKRYLRNISTLTPDENEKLKDFRVCIIGCGGLGGYIVEMLENRNWSLNCCRYGYI